MDDFDSQVLADLRSYVWWLFEGCAQQARTRLHLGTCVEARLHEARRKTHQPVAEKLAETPEEADALRQRINRAHLGEWSDPLVRRRLHTVARAVIPDAVALVIDDTGIEKKGVKSPGVCRQYTGTAGKVTNCQVVVSTHLASHTASVPLEMDLYLPKTWVNDAERLDEAGIPADVAFRKKGQIALDQVDQIRANGFDVGVVLADAGYGDSTAFRDALRTRGLHYALGVAGTAKVWRAGEGPDPPPPAPPFGRPPSRALPGRHQPVEPRVYAHELAAEQWQSVALRPGDSNQRLSRFAAVRVRSAHRAVLGRPPGPEEWLIIEWPENEDAPTHYFLSTLPPDTPIEELARLAKLRWRVERDYQDAKQEVGLDQYEGRRWVGFNHHLTICIAAMTYLVACRAFSPRGVGSFAGRSETPPTKPSPGPLGALPAL
jgi:SRSO17 transposase